MTFEYEKESKQLSFFDSAVAATEPRKERTLAHRELPAVNKTPRFITLSAAVHAAAVLAIMVISIPLVQEANKETITVEIAEPEMRLPTHGAPVLPTQGGTLATAQKELPALESKDLGGPSEVVEVKAPEIEKAIVSKPATTHKAAAAKPVKAAVAARSVAPKTTVKAVPLTIDDINSPELEPGELATTKVSSDLNEDYNEDFEKIDNSHRRALEDEQSKMNAMADALNAEQDEALKEVSAENEEASAKLAAEQQALRKKNAKAIAAALASERAAAAAAAKAQAEQEASAKAARNGNGLGGEGNGSGQANGAGAGNNGVNQSSNRIAGSSEGVRSLDQLRQMPGNPRPQYDRDERLRGDQGKVSFVAYITKEGIPVRFRKIQSTGYANLDTKTLKVLKQWRFYPGQEGWVEIPFRWDLKGGAQQDGGRLRTAVSQM
ncbi:MAG: energy transducer TonB [Bacillota bacterium]